MRIIKKCSLILASLLLVGSLLTPSFVLADTNTESVCEGLALTGGQCGPDDPNGPGVNKTVKLAINIMSLIVAVVSVVMIIVGGLKYVTSSGDSNNLSSAKNTILYALIGLVIVALSQIIVRFVLNRFS